MKGSYVLIIKLKKDSQIKIGSLGLIDFSKGYYCYVGSALGNTINLENRIGRHKKLNREKEGRLHWHIDYFLVNPNALIIQIVTIENEKRMECKISKMLEKAAKRSIQGFGSSDCKCKSHFHYFDNKENCPSITIKGRGNKRTPSIARAYGSSHIHLQDPESSSVPAFWLGKALPLALLCFDQNSVCCLWCPRTGSPLLSLSI